ncbi:MAG TPA: PEP/pyruvate-binding domain-containing protein [Candidatus Rifleibacterium sp.]|jgi:pyruvate,water dikinase|nr:PEP/pyruvate-binding domain-containing protein [Candidatus Rifleibacterium sp.]
MYIVSCANRNFAEVLPLVGGKGGNLLKLTEAGADVPAFAILTRQCFDDFIDSFRDEFKKKLKAIDCSSPDKIARTAGELRACICGHKIPEKIRTELFATLRSLFKNDCFMAVRSSALGEDSKEFSYAGMLDTCLFRRTDEEICEAVVTCWSSIFSDRAVAYRNMRGIPQDDVSMAVVVQEMIDGVASGVTFTVNPTTRYQDEILITSVFGLGEGLVSGTLDSDQFICLKKENYPVIETQLADKVEKLVFDREKNYGTKTVEVPADQAKKPSLSEAQLRNIATVCHRIEGSYSGVPQDIEWTIDGAGRVRILQARPITTIDKPVPSERQYSTIWDNSNIVESYSGVTTPLTFSFAIYAYHRVYVQFCQVLMVPEEEIKANDFAFANMLGFLNGRIYYNLKNWYRLISVLPGYSYNSRFMEGMMGVKVSYDKTVKHKPMGFFQKYFCELPRLALVGANLAYRFWRTDAEVKHFMQVYQEQYDKYKDFDFNAAPAHQLVDIFNELDNTVLANWKAPIINDFMAMIFYGVLDALMKKWELNADPALKNDLLAGQGNVESTLPLRTIQKIARFVSADDELKELFRNKTAAQLKEMFIPLPGADRPSSHQQLGAQVADYLEKYGYRAMCELKLEEPSMNEKPEFLFDMIKNYSAAPMPEEGDVGDKERKVREAAELKVRTLLRDDGIFFGLIKKIDILMFVANWAKKAMAVREYQRFARTRMYGLVSRIYKAFGRRFVERGLLDKVDDIFYLTMQETLEYVTGTARSQKLRELAALRRAEFDEYRAMDELPDRIETTGITYCNDLTRGMLPAQAGDDDPDIIRGIGGCSGKVTGKVKVILNPGDDMSLNGEILVAARTDPGWVPLFATASALLIERGSMLSHSVIVARELGLPAVVGATGVTKKVKTGDVVELDGTTGIVKIISRA